VSRLAFGSLEMTGHHASARSKQIDPLNKSVGFWTAISCPRQHIPQNLLHFNFPKALRFIRRVCRFVVARNYTAQLAGRQHKIGEWLTGEWLINQLTI
jgi:hypothetical protein